MRPKVNLGDEVKELITGFTGIAVAMEYWLTGVNKVQVQSQKLLNEEPIDPHRFDIEELQVTKPGVFAPVPIQYDGPIKLGDRVKDKGSEYEGVVRAKRVSLPGCVQFSVHATRAGMLSPASGYWYHAEDLELVKDEERRPVPAGAGTGPTGAITESHIAVSFDMDPASVLYI